MKLQPYIEKLNSSEEYKEFSEKYKDAYLIAGFFILDLEMNQNIHQVDYYLPSEEKVAAFTLDGDVKVQILEALTKKVPEKLDLSVNTDLDELQGIIEDEMKNRNMSEDIKKIIAVLQMIDGKKVWNLNCVLSGMNLLRTHVEDSSKTVLLMEKSSLLDLMKKVPAHELRMGGKSEEDAKEKIKKLAKLEEAIEKEKAKLEAEGKSGDTKNEEDSDDVPTVNLED